VDGHAALAAVRPEAVRVSTEQPTDGRNSISGELANTSHLGDVIQFVVLTPDRKEVIARLPRPDAPRLDVGGRVWCSWEADHTHVFGAEQAEIVLADPASDEAVAIAG
jgi:spermidine/putrescine transport system ATP-binding protein